MAFLVSFSLGGAAIAGDTPAATGEVIVVASLTFNKCLPRTCAKCEWLDTAKSSPNPRRVSATVQDCAHADNLFLSAIINRKRETFTATPMVFENFGMNTTVNRQRVYVLENAVQEMCAETAALPLVK